MLLVTFSSAARNLDIDRSTVRRYCRREPGLIERGKVDLEGLKAVIAYCKSQDGRGFPIGKKRHPRLDLRTARRGKPIILRTLSKRLEIIAQEFNAMTDAEQMQVLKLGPAVWFRMFRVQNVTKAVSERSASTDT
jgi:hypothetical protein